MVKTGDIVRFLNSVGGGRVTRIAGELMYVEDEDGFETPVLKRECVVVAEAQSQAARVDASERAHAARQAASAPQTPQPQAPAYVPEPALTEAEIAETPGGDILNVVIGYEPHDIRSLSTTEFDAYLVNDSNYYLSFSYLTRRAGEVEAWQLRYSGVVEPNIQLLIGTVARDTLVDMDHICVQFTAYKQGKTFALKTPVSVEHRIDTTKFCKLHCFGDNLYFDTPVIALDIVRDDKPYSPVRFDPREMKHEMQRKAAADRRPVRRQVRKQPKLDIIEVDLHITELIDNTRGLSNADMLNVQIDEFRRVMDANLRNHGQRIVFIHGKGEGVLRQALLKELNHRYKGHDVQDASFREYGFGATQVTIR